MGGRQAPVVSECFYKNGFLTYLSLCFFFLDQEMEKWKEVINKLNQWHRPSCVLEDGLQYVHSQALGLMAIRISLCYEERQIFTNFAGGKSGSICAYSCWLTAASCLQEH